MIELTKSVLSAIGVETGLDERPRFWEGGVWDGKRWVQGLYGQVLYGTLPGGGGGSSRASVCVGTCVPVPHDLLRVDGLERALIASGHRGIVAAMLDDDQRVVRVVSELPAGGTLAMRQGIRGSSWDASPSPLMESWAVSLEVQAAVPAQPPLPERIAKHWHWGPGDPVGWATAWSDRLADAVRRAERTVTAVGRELCCEIWRRVGVLSDLRRL